MNDISFTVWGEPVAQARPKFARAGNHVIAYDPAKSRSYKQDVKMAALEVRPERPLECPLSLTVKVFRSIPKGFSKKKAARALAGELRPATKPDLDNIVKGLKDALKGVVWCDDSQVVNLTAGKWYSDRPRVEITIRPA